MRYGIRIIPTDNGDALKKYFKASGVDPEGIRIISQKVPNLVVRVDGVRAEAANIIKQQLLSLGQDAAVHRDVISGKPESSTVYIVCDRRNLDILKSKFKYQPFGLKALGESIVELADRYSSPPSRLELRNGKLDLSSGPLVMGVINVTPDSFSDGGDITDPEAAAERAFRMVEEGASIIDVGGESSRPGAREIEPGEEIERVGPVLERLAGRIPVPVSIDTRNSEVAEAAISSGAEIINDISGLTHDPKMAAVVAGSGAAVVVMHMLGTPENMQDDPSYDDAVGEILGWLERRASDIIGEGVPADKIIIDPGIGFGKRLRDNLDIIRELSSFRSLGYPVLIGYSRKSFLGALTGREPKERVSGGLASLGWCLAQGAQIVRVHDVAETSDYIKVWKAIKDKRE